MDRGIRELRDENGRLLGECEYRQGVPLYTPAGNLREEAHFLGGGISAT